MVIGNQTIFMGAYAERVSDRTIPVHFPNMVNAERQQEITTLVEDAMQEVKFSRPDRDTVTVSEEAKAFLCSEAGYEKMKADTEEMLSMWYGSYVDKQEELQKRNPEDPFWGSTGNQWLVFSEHLYNRGFYDDMSDEQVKSVEKLLDKMTGYMDGFSRMSYGISMDINAVPGEMSQGFNMLTESGDLWMDLESSTAALRLFGEKMIGDETLRQEFDSLVDQYYEHNARLLVRYQSPTEKMRQMREGKYSYTEFLELSDQRLKEILEQQEKEAVEEFANAGGAQQGQDVTGMGVYVTELHKIFEQLRQGAAGWETARDMLKEACVDYGLKESRDQKLIAKLSEQTDDTLERLEEYWSALL